MKSETLEGRPFTDLELLCKNAYMESSEDLWSKPLSFSEYDELLKQNRLVFCADADLYRDRTIDRKGITNMDVETSFNAAVVIHPRYSYPVIHNHSYIEIVYVASGHCTNLFKDSSFEMKEGDVCILSPNSFHALSCTDDDTCVVNLLVSLKFFGQKFLDMLRGGKLVADFLENILYKRATSPYILFHTGADPWLKVLAQRLIAEENQKPYAYEYSTSLLASEFLLHISREYEMLAIVPDRNGETQNELIVSILGYLTVNYNRTTLSETAAFFGYSVAYLSRIIRENTGKNYNRIITELQMEQAVRMLVSDNMSLTEIALSVGCFDSSHFTKKFKSVYNLTPSQYIQKHYRK